VGKKERRYKFMSGNLFRERRILTRPKPQCTPRGTGVPYGLKWNSVKSKKGGGLQKSGMELLWLGYPSLFGTTAPLKKLLTAKGGEHLAKAQA